MKFYSLRLLVSDESGWTEEKALEFRDKIAKLIEGDENMGMMLDGWLIPDEDMKKMMEAQE